MSVKQTLTIREYDRLYVRQHRNLEKKIISEKDSVQLQQIVVNNSPIFRFGNRCLIAQKWVGTISLSDFTIEILPKIFDEFKVKQSRDILIRMLLISHMSTNIRRMPSSSAMKEHSLIEMLIETFLEQLQRYVETGLQHDYKKVSQNMNKIKGKILFNKHLTKNIWDPTKFYCCYSKFQEDTLLNQFFKSCLLCMSDVTNDVRNKRIINDLMPCFYYVSELTKEEVLNLDIQFNILNMRAEEAYKYGCMFFNNLYATLNAGTTKIYSMLFDMNQLYELFIYRTALLALGNRVAYQKKAGYVVSSKCDNKNYICMRPDLTIKNSSGEEIIVDTKWKVPKQFAKESDIYQMNAYSTSSKRISKVILLYPYLESTQKLTGEYKFLLDQVNVRTLEIKTIDLRKVTTWNTFMSELKNTLAL